MYDRNLKNYDFFKPLNSREKGRMQSLWRRVCWLKDKADLRYKEGKKSENLYRREYSALLWAHDYIWAHDKQIREMKGQDERQDSQDNQ